MFHVCFDLSFVYGVRICVDVCGVVCVAECCLFLKSLCGVCCGVVGVWRVMNVVLSVMHIL